MAGSDMEKQRSRERTDMSRSNNVLPGGVSVNIQHGRRTPRVIKAFTSDRALWIGSPVFILLVWEAVTRFGLVPPLVLLAPTAILRTLFGLITSGELLPHIGFSLFRSLLGFIVGSTLGILLGLMMGWSRFVNNVLDIPFNIFRAIPKAALIPVFIVWFGIGEFPKILLLSLTNFVMCVINTTAGVRSVDMTMIKAARSLGAKSKDILWEVVLPAASPMIFAALRVGVVFSLVMLVIVEMTAAEKGLGAFIIESQRLFYIDKMFAGIVTMAVFAFTLDVIVKKIGERALKWHKGIGVDKG
jgi:ABC-type nitrate/sulfonate/bicarbonate transport system permease component